MSCADGGDWDGEADRNGPASNVRKPSNWTYCVLPLALGMIVFAGGMWFDRACYSRPAGPVTQGDGAWGASVLEAETSGATVPMMSSSGRHNACEGRAEAVNRAWVMSRLAVSPEAAVVRAGFARDVWCVASYRALIFADVQSNLWRCVCLPKETR